MKHTKKSLGQNFLINRGVLDKITNTAEIEKDDTVLEIGPGTGILTEKLIEKAGRVIAVEKDRRFVEFLKTRVSTDSAGAKGVDVVEEDILKFNPSRYGLSVAGYKVIGNIPYYLTSQLLKTIFEKWPTPKLVVLMIQKEVAQRIVAQPPKMNILALSVQFYSEPKIISYVSKGSFRPIPKVDSAIIRLLPRPKVVPEVLLLEQRGRFFKIIKKAFAGKRKQLKNTIGVESLGNTGVRPESRPEELSLEAWLRIAARV